MRTTVLIDDQMPRDALYATVTTEETRVTVSPDVQPHVLPVLETGLAVEVAGCVDADRKVQGEGE
jgi:hypothetical protein